MQSLEGPFRKLDSCAMDSVPFETLHEGGMSRRAKWIRFSAERSSRFQQKVELTIEKNRGRSRDRPRHRATALTGGPKDRPLLQGFLRGRERGRDRHTHRAHGDVD